MKLFKGFTNWYRSGKLYQQTSFDERGIKFVKRALSRSIRRHSKGFWQQMNVCWEMRICE